MWPRTAEALQAAGHDVVWVGDWPRDPGDRSILEAAYNDGRILVTLDKDFGDELAAGAIITADPNRIRVRPPAR